jgi:uncharacterized membrane protein
VPTTPLRNEFGTAGVVSAVIALLFSRGLPSIGIALGMIALALSGGGIKFAVRRDYGMGRAVTGLLVAVLAIVIGIFEIGIRKGGTLT